jgi:hypothetical protein
VGVDFSPDGRTLYVGGGRNNDVKIFTMAPAGTFAAEGSIPIPESAPSGLDVNANGSGVRARRRLSLEKYPLSLLN